MHDIQKQLKQACDKAVATFPEILGNSYHLNQAKCLLTAEHEPRRKRLLHKVILFDWTDLVLSWLILLNFIVLLVWFIFSAIAVPIQYTLWDQSRLFLQGYHWVLQQEVIPLLILTFVLATTISLLIVNLVRKRGWHYQLREYTWREFYRDAKQSRLPDEFWKIVEAPAGYCLGINLVSEGYDNVTDKINRLEVCWYKPDKPDRIEYHKQLLLLKKP